MISLLLLTPFTKDTNADPVPKNVQPLFVTFLDHKKYLLPSNL